MNKIIDQLDEFGFFPIVEIADVQSVRPLCDALLSSDVPVIEIVLRTPSATEAMRIVRDEFPAMLLGAGTVLSPEDAKKATDAGAKFLLSPGFNPRVIDYCIEHNITIVPGVNTPTLIEWALEKGIDVVKFFPAEASGGLEYLKSMSNPFKKVRFVPTGGVNSTNLSAYLGFDKVVACGGTWIAKNSLINAGKFDEIVRIADESQRTMLGFELASLVVNARPEESDSFGRIVELLFPVKNIPAQARDNGCRRARISETPGSRNQDIIEISTSSIKRATAYLLRKGFKSLEDTDPTAAPNKSILLEQVSARYALKLVEKV